MATLTITQGALNLACMGDPSETVEGPTLDGTPLADVVQLARATRVTVIDRGNRVRTLEWKVRRKAAANAVQALYNALAEEFALEASLGSPIVVSYGQPTGMVLTITDGALTHRCEHVGRMAVHTYRLQFGQGSVANYDFFLPIEGVTPLYGIVRIVTTGGGYWMQILDTGVAGWLTIFWTNGVLTTSPTTPGAAIGCRINGGFLQLADLGVGGFRDIWWNDVGSPALPALQCGPVDNTAVDGGPPTAFRLYSAAGSIYPQLTDQASASPPQFRTLFLTAGAAKAGPLIS